jgi:hypothetical protein
MDHLQYSRSWLRLSRLLLLTLLLNQRVVLNMSKVIHPPSALMLRLSRQWVLAMRRRRKWLMTNLTNKTLSQPLQPMRWWRKPQSLQMELMVPHRTPLSLP